MIYQGVTSYGNMPKTGGSEGIQSFGHDLRNLGKSDCGGPMILNRNVNLTSLKIETKSTTTKGSTIGVNPSTGLLGTLLQPSQVTMHTQGATAISRCIPTDPGINLADSIAQSIGVNAIPKMVGAAFWREKTKFFKALSGEYLNIEFGWRPFVSDIFDSMKAVKNSHQILNDLDAGSGKNTRVGYAFPESSTFDLATKGLTVQSWDGSKSFSNGTSNSYSGITTTNTWFKGCFRYVLPKTRGNMSQLEKHVDYANRVLGLGVNEITPELLWDAAPWTWAVDWAANVGDILHNTSALSHDSLVLLYGYIMTHKKAQAVWTAGGNPVSAGLQFTQLQEWKMRFPASPYGFGLSYTGLTLQQKAILAAAGISQW